MSRTTVTAFDNATKKSISLQIPVVDIAQDYSILERNTEAGQTVLSNISSDPTLQEFISYGYGSLKEVRVNPKMVPVYPPTTEDGFQFVIKDEWIERTTETDGTVHDDLCQEYHVFKTTRGANYVDGTDILPRFLRNLGIAASVVESSTPGTYELSTDTLDRLLHGVTKPSAAS